MVGARRPAAGAERAALDGSCGPRASGTLCGSGTASRTTGHPGPDAAPVRRRPRLTETAHGRLDGRATSATTGPAQLPRDADGPAADDDPARWSADKDRIAPDDDGESMLMPAVEVLALLRERYNADARRGPRRCRQWHAKYLAAFDAGFDAMVRRPGSRLRGGRRSTTRSAGWKAWRRATTRLCSLRAGRFATALPRQQEGRKTPPGRPTGRPGAWSPAIRAGSAVAAGLGIGGGGGAPPVVPAVAVLPPCLGGGGRSSCCSTR